jgi:hypothetical protein
MSPMRRISATSIRTNQVGRDFWHRSFGTTRPRHAARAEAVAVVVLPVQDRAREPAVNERAELLAGVGFQIPGRHGDR